MITIYTIDRCNKCTQLKQFLEKKGFKYEEIKVNVNDLDMIKMFQEKTLNLNMPKLKIAENWYSGFDREALETTFRYFKI